MQKRVVILLGIAVFIGIIGIIVLIGVFTPESNPAFDTAVKFVQAAGSGEDETAFSLLSETMKEYVRENCPEGSVSACVETYIPDEWGKFLSVVYRRSRLVSSAWDVLLIASYEKGQGFSGVCIYTRMEQNEVGEWRVFGWSGFVSCDEPNAGLNELAEAPDAPNRVMGRE
jgi:hypothetical protein